MSVGHDSPGSLGSLLPGLEDQLDGSLKFLSQLHENLCHPKANGSVAVVAAGMHFSLIHGGKAFPEGPVGFLLLLNKPQGVNVKPQGNHRPRAAAQNPHGAGKAFFHVLCQVFLRRPLAECQFCMGF
jgi:hypothetical protein